MFSKLKKLLKRGQFPDLKDKGSDKGIPSVRPVNTGKQDFDHAVKHDINDRKQACPKKSDPKKEYISKKGIRVFDKTHDLGSLFGIDTEIPAPQNSQTSQNLRVIKAKTLTKSRPANVRTNRHGIPILDQANDMFDFMREKSLENAEARLGDTPKRAVIREKTVIKDKHGIPILPHRGNVVPTFLHDNNEEVFSELLSESLGQKSRDVLLNEKGTAHKQKPLTLKQTLKRYPGPQEQLDLHGYTAVKADQKANAYLTSAYKLQTHTVVIIVGKGLHSEAGAVIPDVVEERLKKLKKEGIVLDYE